METLIKSKSIELIVDENIKPFQVDYHVRSTILSSQSEARLDSLIEKYSLTVTNNYFKGIGLPDMFANKESTVHSFYNKNESQFEQDFPILENLPSTPFPFKEKDKIVVNNIPNGIRHSNYLSYLKLCWNNHYPIVIRPDYFHQIVLCEVAGYIKKNAEKYRSLFTTSSEKKQLTVHTSDPYILPLHSIIDQLIKHIPSDITSLLPEFSTTTESSRFAFAAAFCDAMSPYYSYSMLMCGIPKARVEGTIEDWQKVVSSLRSVAPMLHLDDYLYKVEKAIQNILNAIVFEDGKYLQGMFSLVRCGSGSQTEVDGWITDLFLEYPQVGYVNNFSSCVSSVEYKNLTTNKEYIMKSGLLRSNLEGEYVVPDFTFVVYEK